MDTARLDRTRPSGGATGELCLASMHRQIANVGDFPQRKGNTMEKTAIQTALETLVRNDGKTGVAAFDYMMTALALVQASEDYVATADDLIVQACDATGSRGKVTEQFPKGKANPNAIKANGFAMTAECVRLVRKAAKALDEGNERVADVVEGTLGIVRNATLLQQAIDGDSRVAKAGDDEAKRERAIAKVTADYLAATYGDNRCDSFASLRRMLDKATAPKAETTSDSDSDSEGEGEGNVSAAAAVIGVADIISRLPEMSDDDLLALFDAAKAEMTARTAADDSERKAA